MTGLRGAYTASLVAPRPEALDHNPEVACWHQGHRWMVPSFDTRRPYTAADRQRINQAKADCHRCPVLDTCRRYALSPVDPVPFHVAGGLTPAERRQIRNMEAVA